MRPVSFPVSRMAGVITVTMMLTPGQRACSRWESARCSALSAGFPFIHEQGAEPVGTRFPHVLPSFPHVDGGIYFYTPLENLKPAEP